MRVFNNERACGAGGFGHLVAGGIKELDGAGGILARGLNLIGKGCGAAVYRRHNRDVFDMRLRRGVDIYRSRDAGVVEEVKVGVVALLGLHVVAAHDAVHKIAHHTALAANGQGGVVDDVGNRDGE